MANLPAATKMSHSCYVTNLKLTRLGKWLSKQLQRYISHMLLAFVNCTIINAPMVQDLFLVPTLSYLKTETSIIQVFSTFE